MSEVSVDFSLEYPVNGQPAVMVNTLWVVNTTIAIRTPTMPDKLLVALRPRHFGHGP